ncbi:hypothetical protein [Streptomyces chattanoogensis]|uniref:Chaplin domain-containing protein n=1 Tax=Streptomyces chattanoogensis TaxID=66876 RepID=A0A0N0H2L3_9ACTN|nr:hypothetical protein [Streptomyces chattanoogensis]AJT65768.1 hypothetical protein T261_4111 [Streptomyces lydicus]KPC65449.1 hypothetical protein ADL29_07185 [Streptomyces chattanoogensis]
MGKLRKAAVVATVLGSVSFLGAGTASAAGHGGNWCRSHDLNVDVLGQVGIANGIAGNILNGEGGPGGQFGGVGSSMGCNGGGW